MKIPRRRFLELAAGAAALPAVSRIAGAQSYPTRPVRIIVPFIAGASSDIIARLIGQWLSERLGQQFIVENRPGAGGNIGTEAVVHAPPDGYTLLFAATANAINATLYEKLNFNFIRDIAPVAGLVRLPNVVEVNPSVPVKTVAELITYAKANPGKINMATAGIGVSGHMAGELFKAMTGINMVHVPYRGSTPALTDLIGGQVNAPHCFPINAHDMRAFAMPASQNLDWGSACEAVGAGSGTRQRPFLALGRAGSRQSYEG
jgi:tripartite-type tricarboxylate transporter receptor subunit TctC